ncbi:MAG: acyl-CoA synthetase, partial [Actinomyces sp.]
MSTTSDAYGPRILTPTAYLDRAELVHGDRTAVLDEGRRLTYAEFAERCRRLAGATRRLGLEPGDRASVLAPNTSLPLEAHFGLPYAGVVLNALNSRLSAGELAYIVGHAGSKVLFCDHTLVEVGRSVQAEVEGLELVVHGGDDDTYEELLAGAEPHVAPVDDENTLLSLNYTSGTTGRPKGVMYSHRGAHLNALSMAAQAGLDADTVFLWTLPLFHCNGWCFPWAVTAAGGTHVTLREVDPARIWRHIREDGVTHFNAAPTVLTALANHPDA